MENSKPRYDPDSEGWQKLDEIGYPALMGLIWRKPEAEGALYGLPATPEILNKNGRVHGWALLGLVDHALGHTARYFGIGEKKATIQLDTQFIGAPEDGDFLVARGFLVRRTRSILFMRCEVTVGDRLIATANGIWKLLGV